MASTKGYSAAALAKREEKRRRLCTTPSATTAVHAVATGDKLTLLVLQEIAERRRAWRR